ncbi:unnamed protein product [Ectocarpus sp. CCAP 1310/34]|nr:unnamed protein product [Ectocarpus sp. CCAP 1310/34]
MMPICTLCTTCLPSKRWGKLCCGLNIQSCGMMQAVEIYSVCWMQELLVRCSNQ